MNETINNFFKLWKKAKSKDSSLFLQLQDNPDGHTFIWITRKTERPSNINEVCKIKEKSFIKACLEASVKLENYIKELSK